MDSAINWSGGVDFSQHHAAFVDAQWYWPKAKTYPVLSAVVYQLFHKADLARFQTDELKQDFPHGVTRGGFALYHLLKDFFPISRRILVEWDNSSVSWPSSRKYPTALLGQTFLALHFAQDKHRNFSGIRFVTPRKIHKYFGKEKVTSQELFDREPYDGSEWPGMQFDKHGDLGDALRISLYQFTRMNGLETRFDKLLEQINLE